MFSRCFKQGFLPLLFYLVVFVILTFPLILKFSSHFFTDAGDGLQNIWNIWWVNKAVTELHANPWHTNYLFHPFGTSLLAHTLNPFNGFVGVVLLKLFSLTQTYNLLVIFAFVAGGWTTFLLAFHLTRHYGGSLLAGFIFTFSNYHFTHAEGHMQLVSLQWLPLFVLCWYMLMQRPSLFRGLSAALALFGVILCDYYYFFYCVMIAAIMLLWQAIQSRDIFFLFRKKYFGPFVIFLMGFSVTSGPLVYALLRFTRENTLLGVHHPRVYSLDLLAPIIPGGHWGFASWTEFYWSRLPGNIHESSVHMGLVVILLIVFTWFHRQKLQITSLKLWYAALAVFLILSLGPVLHIWGKEFAGIKLPYALLEWLIPPLKLGGVPVRMMVMVMLCAALIVAIGFKQLLQKLSGRRWILVLLLALLCVEYYPKSMPATQLDIPGYVQFLQQASSKQGVIDTVTPMHIALYYQTVYEKPMAAGYIARHTERAQKKTERIFQLVRERQFSLLYHGYHFRYYVTKESRLISSERTRVFKVFQDGDVYVYDLGAAYGSSALSD